MSKIFMLPKISSYEELLAERERLEILLQQQKNRVRIGVNELREEFKDKMKPAAEVANFIQKMTDSDVRKRTALDIGTNVTIELLIRKLFSKSAVAQLILTPLLKTYTARFISGLKGKHTNSEQV